MYRDVATRNVVNRKRKTSHELNTAFLHGTLVNWEFPLSVKVEYSKRTKPIELVK